MFCILDTPTMIQPQKLVTFPLSRSHKRNKTPCYAKSSISSKETHGVRNPSVILSPTLARNEKVEHYIRIKTHKPIALRFWVESGVSVLYG